MEIDRLTLAQWLSPAFPLGSYAYSHGLEAAMDGGQVRDAQSLAAWLRTLISQGSGWNDALLLLAARRGEAGVDDLARALAASQERLEETEALGAAFAHTLSGMGVEAEAGPMPVVFGTASRRLALPDTEVAALYLQAFASNLILAAVRFLPLGQNAGQALIAQIAPLCVETAERAARATLDDLGSGAFMADIAAMRHERLDVRIFKT